MRIAITQPFESEGFAYPAGVFEARPSPYNPAALEAFLPEPGAGRWVPLASILADVAPPPVSSPSRR